MDVERVGPVATVGRGMRGRCGRCGGRRIRVGFFRLHERCPSCGYRFKREEGFFTGVFLVNFGATLALLFVGIMVWILVRVGAPPGQPVWPVLVAGVAVALVAPVLLYPWAATTWAALDLAMRPLAPEEEAEAALHQQ